MDGRQGKNHGSPDRRGATRRRVLEVVAGLGGGVFLGGGRLAAAAPPLACDVGFRPCGDACYNPDFSRCCACGQGAKIVVPSGLPCSKAVKDANCPA